MPSIRRRGTALAAFLAVLTGCFGRPYWTPIAQPPEAASTPAPVRDTVKVHLQSGDLALLTVWHADASARRLSGVGTWYDPGRRPVDSGQISIPFDSIALVETHRRDVAHPFGLSGLVVWTALMTPVTVGCTADPKACFGSCPTFYVGTDSVPRAEGFSASFARALEATDLDALGSSRGGRTFSVRMRNEALETHAVRSLHLLVAPRPPGGRAFALPDGRLVGVTRLRAPAGCAAAEGDCANLVRSPDRRERVSATDSSDLGARETVDLVFPPAVGRTGLVLAARHTLVSTFLFYQSMAYFGHHAGQWLAALERAGPSFAASATGLAEALGGIEVLVPQRDTWIPAGTWTEAGPIATDVVMFPLPPAPGSHDSVRVRLRLARGAWRLDWVAMASLEEPVGPIRLAPSAVYAGGRPDTAALRTLRDTTRHLVTYPGDEYEVVFVLPDVADDLELFLESRGFYYEWMRGEWLRETNAELARRAVDDPEGLLRFLAPAFKRVEPEMERLFWSSRFGR